MNSKTYITSRVDSSLGTKLNKVLIHE